MSPGKPAGEHHTDDQPGQRGAVGELFRGPALRRAPGGGRHRARDLGVGAQPGLSRRRGNGGRRGTVAGYGCVTR